MNYSFSRHYWNWKTYISSTFFRLVWTWKS